MFHRLLQSYIQSSLKDREGAPEISSWEQGRSPLTGVRVISVMIWAAPLIITSEYKYSNYIHTAVYFETMHFFKKMMGSGSSLSVILAEHLYPRLSAVNINAVLFECMQLGVLYCSPSITAVCQCVWF